MHFRAVIEQGDKTATGITVPDEIVTALGAGKKPKVTVTVNGYTYRTSIATVSGSSKFGVSAEVRAAAGVKGGDEVDVEIALDTAPREVVVPPDFAAALDGEPAARATFDRISYSEKRWFVLGIEDAKTPETRQRRIDKAIERLREGRGQR
jgi:predicted ThiF/HesA family dinucleotide-utilizing enzyme